MALTDTHILISIIAIVGIVAIIGIINPLEMTIPSSISGTQENIAGNAGAVIKPRCGDRSCNGRETCSSCPRDCGACPPPKAVCGNGVCEAGETCEWYGAENRQMLCDGQHSALPTGGSCSTCTYTAPETVDTKTMWPSAAGKRLVYHNIVQDNYEVMINQRWDDGNTFTVHHLYTNDPTSPQWCPRVSDVFTWDGTRLIYTDTYDFYKGIHTKITAPGHVWNDASDVVGGAYSVDAEFIVTTFTNVDCSATDEQPSYQQETTIWRGMFHDTATSEMTGSVPVDVYRFDETTYFNKNSDDWFKEEWYMHKDPVEGWVPIVSKGYRKNLGSTTVETLWDMRLMRIE